ncbi:xanthine dehydrogenase family protein subunit M [Amorphus sp. 3PC139-8]|uniref:FAD binding domain-containing protein n=1 Tax=Amorphus sp. 3PC139-8 TaxID=2735676 RepID=UPI00345D025B
MKPAPFDYVRPEGLEESLEVLAAHGADATVLAGGQSLMPLLATRAHRPRVLVDINRIGAAHGAIETDGDALTMGALVRHRDVIVDANVVRNIPMLAEAGRLIGNVAIRNRGTVGGSIAFADPAAEWPLCFVALGGSVRLASKKGERTVPAAEFFRGSHRSVRRSDELVVAARFPVPRFAYFDEISLRPTAPAFASLALAQDRDGTLRVALGAVADRPITIEATAVAALGTNPDWGEVRAIAGQELGDRLPADERSYRLHLVMTLLGRAARAYAKASDRDRL